MRNKSIKWLSPISVILALTFIFGTGSHALAKPPAQADLGPSGFDNHYGCGLVNAARATGISNNNEPGDTIPPVTTIELSGLQGNGDWYRSDVTVGLTAVDNPGGSGVAKTEYSLDAGETWHTYSSPPHHYHRTYQTYSIGQVVGQCRQ